MKRINKSKIKKGLALSAVSLVAVVIVLEVGGLGFFTPAHADTLWNLLYSALNSVLFNLIIVPFGWVATIFTGLLLAIAGGDVSFVSMPAVAKAWVVVRDVGNIFFLITLLIIAFGTVLGVESYGYKKLLPRLIIMAVLINFSKTICGIFTDLATVIMKSFMAAIGGSAASDILTTLNIHQITKATPPAGTIDTAAPSPTEQGASSLTLTLILVAVMLGVMIVVLAVWIIVLLFRLAMLWFLIVLSPLAFAAYAIPGGQKYSSQWWQLFGNYVMVGPLITFFLWLALFVAVNAGATNVGSKRESNPYIKFEAPAGTKSEYIVKMGMFEASDPDVIVGFLIAVMMLVAGLQLSKQMASEAGFLTNKVQSRVSGAVTGWAKGALKYGAVTTGVGALGTAGYMAGKYGGRYAYRQAKDLLQEGALATITGPRIGRVLGTILPDRVMKNAYEKRAALRKSRRKRGEISVQAFRDLPASARKRLFDRGFDKNNPIDPATGKLNFLDGYMGDNAEAAAKVNPADVLAGNQDHMEALLLGMKPSEIAEIKVGAWKIDPRKRNDFLYSMKNHLESSDDQRQRNIFNSLSGDKQRALESVGYTAPTVQPQFGGPGGGGPGGGGPGGGGPGGGGPMEDIDQAKFNRTQNAIRKKRNFYKSKEYKKNPEKYYSQEEFDTLRPSVELMKRYGGLESRKKFGFGRVGERKGESMELAADFTDPALAGLAGVSPDKAGLNISVTDKAVETLASRMRQQLEAESEKTGKTADQINKEVETFKADLGKAKDIKLVNIGRRGSRAQEVLEHERAHTVAREMPAAERTRITGARKFASREEEEEFVVKQLVSSGPQIPNNLNVEIHNNNNIQTALGQTGAPMEMLGNIQNELQNLSSQGEALNNLQAHVRDLQEGLERLEGEGSLTDKAIQKELTILVNKLRRTSRQP